MSVVPGREEIAKELLRVSSMVIVAASFDLDLPGDVWLEAAALNGGGVGQVGLPGGQLCPTGQLLIFGTVVT
ncbi:hypothetical protein ABZ805_03845 [Saccharopolyspora sp. NPDC047091]|uniref:hypothetical protein n=1 Tax=Saccharopolyspora sp. NPDC047091 TaxID=3155924 RepID=UPI0033F68ACF